MTERIGVRLGAWARGEALLGLIIGSMTWLGARCSACRTRPLGAHRRCWRVGPESRADHCRNSADHGRPAGFTDAWPAGAGVGCADPAT